MAHNKRSGSSFEQGQQGGTGTMERQDFEQQGSSGQEASSGGQGILGRAGEMAGNVAGMASGAASSVAESAMGAASSVADTAKNAASNIGSGIKSLGETIRERGPHSGILGTASESVAGTLESTGSFLQEKGLAGIGDELTSCVRNHPMTSIFISLGAGYLLGYLTSRR